MQSSNRSAVDMVALLTSSVFRRNPWIRNLNSSVPSLRNKMQNLEECSCLWRDTCLSQLYSVIISLQYLVRSQKAYEMRLKLEYVCEEHWIIQWTACSVFKTRCTRMSK
jgi:hypothetical protein